MTKHKTTRGLDDAAPRHAELTSLVRRRWTVRVGSANVLIRGARPRDLAAVADMHGRCSPQSLLNRYRKGGRRPAVVALEGQLREPLSFVVVTYGGTIVATAVAKEDAQHGRDAAEVGLLVEDAWQGWGLGRELLSHLAGAALVCGYHQLIAYPGTSMRAVQALLIDVGHTRAVADAEEQVHLHTYLTESAALGLGPVRERLAS
ncbi:MAG TPA: GNAT family N-acetyltransferase [Jatrophihabitantaceae bacterium]|jgi:GNAT superfamily N-acetyltransferase